MDPEYRSDSLDKEDFHQNLKHADILGLTNWVWNQGYNDKIASIYKKYRPDGIVLYGGTNVPEDKVEAKAYALLRPFVDLFFCGPSEKTFKEFLINFPKQGVLANPGTFTQQEFNFDKDKNHYKETCIPMPYLDGIFENLIKNTNQPLTAIFETNRGCPYRCTFCDWGGMTRSKIIRAEHKEVIDTITYIMSHEKINQIEIADANFGIFEMDLQYIEHMVKCQEKRKNKINLIFGGMAKNGSPYAEKIMQLMHENFDAYHGRKYVKLSFQSHNDEVLKISNRSNIKNEKLFSMAKSFQQKGVKVDAEMIIGLPGETQTTWLQTIQTNMDLKINHQKSFVLFVVPNTELSSNAYKNKYQIKTKKVLIPNDLYQLKSRVYHESRNSKPIMTSCNFEDPSEYQSLEFIYECFSYNEVELMKIYDTWFWFNALYNAKVAHKWMLDSKQTAKEQFEIFLTLIESGEMPFFKGLLDEYRSAVYNTLAKPEPVTIIRSLFLANFVVKFGFRGNEVVDIYDHQEEAREELKLIYPKIDFNHFDKDKDLKEKLKLYFVAAEVT